MNTFVAILRVIIGLIIIASGYGAMELFDAAAKRFESSGGELTSLRSVGGKSVDEAFYQEVGSLSIGFASFSRALGLTANTLGLAGGFILIFSRYRPEKKEANQAPEPRDEGKRRSRGRRDRQEGRCSDSYTV